MRIAICDDDHLFLEKAANLFEEWPDKPYELTLKTYTDSDKLLYRHQKQPFDIIFLDIAMPMSSGMDIAKEIREKDKNVKIVFLTSSEDFAIESYSVKASGYILKPANPHHIYKILNELKSEMLASPKKITVKGIGATYRIQLRNIEFIESQNKHVIFYLSDGRAIESATPLYSYEEYLLLTDGFFKCHRSFIVNIYHIDSFNSKDIKMRCGHFVPISRNLRKIFEDTYFSVIFSETGDISD